MATSGVYDSIHDCPGNIYNCRFKFNPDYSSMKSLSLMVISIFLLVPCFISCVNTLLFGKFWKCCSKKKQHPLYIRKNKVTDSQSISELSRSSMEHYDRHIAYEKPKSIILKNQRKLQKQITDRQKAKEKEERRKKDKANLVEDEEEKLPIKRVVKKFSVTPSKVTNEDDIHIIGNTSSKIGSLSKSNFGPSINRKKTGRLEKKEITDSGGKESLTVSKRLFH